METTNTIVEIAKENIQKALAKGCRRALYSRIFSNGATTEDEQESFRDSIGVGWKIKITTIQKRSGFLGLKKVATKYIEFSHA